MTAFINIKDFGDNIAMYFPDDKLISILNFMEDEYNGLGMYEWNTKEGFKNICFEYNLSEDEIIDSLWKNKNINFEDDLLYYHPINGLQTDDSIKNQYYYSHLIRQNLSDYKMQEKLQEYYPIKIIFD